jgi:hypothetical protein
MSVVNMKKQITVSKMAFDYWRFEMFTVSERDRTKKVFGGKTTELFRGSRLLWQTISNSDIHCLQWTEKGSFFFLTEV